MTSEYATASDLRRKFRAAAFWYLQITVTGPFILIYIPSRFIVSGDAAATLAKVASAPALFRIGIVAGFVSSVCFLLTGLALYDLFKPVDRAKARVMAALVAVSVPIGFLGTFFDIALLRLASGADLLKALAPEQVRNLAAALLDMQRQTIYISQIFWGLWLLPLAILVIRSGFFPKFLGVLQVVAGFGYLAASFVFFLFPDALAGIGPVVTIMEMGEVPFILWLVVKAARMKPAPNAAPAAG